MYNEERSCIIMGLDLPCLIVVSEWRNETRRLQRSVSTEKLARSFCSMCSFVRMQSSHYFEMD